MSAAELVDWLKNDRAQRAKNVLGTGVCDLVTSDRAEKVTPKIDPLRGRNGVCDLVTAVTPFFVGVEVERTESRPDRAANDAPMPAPATAPAPDWRQADADYLRHHFACSSCCAAGQGRGQRCAAGAALWTTYEAACAADRITNTKTRGRSAR